MFNCLVFSLLQADTYLYEQVLKKILQVVLIVCAPPLYVHLQYDPDNSGFISTERFRDLLATHGSELDPHKLEVLLALADGNADGKICYQDFVNLVRCCFSPIEGRSEIRKDADFIPLALYVENKFCPF